MNRKLFLLIALFACLALPLGHLAAQDSAPIPAAPTAADYLPDEPNDTFATATAVGDDPAYYSHNGYFMTPADVDTYLFHYDAATTNLGAILIVPDPRFTPRQPIQAALYNAAQTLLAEDTSCEEYGVTFSLSGMGLTPGDYYVRVTPCAGPVNVDAAYDIMAPHAENPYPPSDVEPNDSRATATPVEFGRLIVGAWTPASDTVCDEDWYRFNGRAGDVIDLLPAGSEPVGEITDANGVVLAEPVLPADGVYYLHIIGHSDFNTPPCYADDYAIQLGESLWVSSDVDGLGGAGVKQGDIVTRTADGWALVFDASDVGITKDVVAFERMPNGSLLLALGAAQNVPGLGRVMPHDVIRFLPTSLGQNTAGSFQWQLDGSDVGLSQAGEKIDGLYWREDPTAEAPLVISITGNGQVPRQPGGVLAVADEDVINFVVSSYGLNSAGKWRMSFDGSTRPGMAAEDIVALERVDYPWIDSRSFRLMVLGSAFNLGGLTGGPLDVLDLEDASPAPFRLANKPIDGLALGPAN